MLHKLMSLQFQYSSWKLTNKKEDLNSLLNLLENTHQISFLVIADYLSARKYDSVWF